MKRRRIHVSLTPKEAEALVQLAECASMTYEDAEGVLDGATAIAAGYRAIAKLNHEIYKPVPS